MLRSDAIWDAISQGMERGRWTSVDSIYDIVHERSAIDDEDLEPQAPGQATPKWKRNVRNVLQRRKAKGDIEWDTAGMYRLPMERSW